MCINASFVENFQKYGKVIEFSKSSPYFGEKVEKNVISVIHFNILICGEI